MRRQIQKLVAGVGVAGLLAGCATVQVVEADLSSGAYEFESIELGAYRAYQTAFADTPFADGAVTVIATERGGLRTFSLAPCQSGTHICAGSATGPSGDFEVTPDYTIVRGLYGATFWLSPGGDGALVRGGTTVPLAWE